MRDEELDYEYYPELRAIGTGGAHRLCPRGPAGGEAILLVVQLPINAMACGISAEDSSRPGAFLRQRGLERVALL